MEHNFFKIIPNNVFFSKELTASEKLLFGLVVSLISSKGYCFASNSYLSEKMEVSVKSISRSINTLIKLGFLKSQLIYKSNSKEILERRLYLIIDTQKNTATTYHQNSGHPSPEMRIPLPKNEEDNNISLIDKYNFNNNTHTITSNSNHIKIKERGKEEIHEQVLQSFAKLCPSLPKVLSLSASRKNKIKLRLKEMNNDLEKLNEVFTKIENSSFLKGENNRGWKANFDWIFANGENWIKVLEGNYDTKEIKELTEQEIYIQSLRKQSPVKHLTDDDLLRYHKMAKYFGYSLKDYINKLISEGKIESQENNSK